MSVVSVAISLVGLLSMLNFILLIGVIRRLRHGTNSTGLQTRSLPEIKSLPAGTPISDFQSITVDQAPLSRNDLQDGMTVGFFMVDCGTCHEKLPYFISAAQRGETKEQVIAVVVGDAIAAEEMVTQLTSVGRVIVEDHFGPVATAFAVSSFPTMCSVRRDGDELFIGSTRTASNPTSLPTPANTI
ncbi:hypothetical protein Sme01_16980 [Sphaerisporangium melleum]|uniref:Thioredoxin domain-containing protein n=1 Tax=Sphaerisporangium melleum TaxID=321316 RepID=A0A917R1T0_9ACTN|nr:hypothetical protein [Sphaerisporangium melleum]GGK82974.1 hypothetical protein GCM10007964_26920 [Sphaerisporangium melleum]GII69222.1 hypothetical protein Sme01_16980 [Sphaerisporangium melleum]